MKSLRELKESNRRGGRPLYLSVSDAVREAIDAGTFVPGTQMPSTKSLALQLNVSLVTTHRAMKELVNVGVLQRSQGRGTFVHKRYPDRSAKRPIRIGLHQADVALAATDARLLCELVKAAAAIGADFLWLGNDEDVRNECDAILLIDPPVNRIDELVDAANRKPIVLIDAYSSRADSIEIDPDDLANRAIEHVTNHGHRRIGYVGCDLARASAARRWGGFVHACDARGIRIREEDVIHALDVHLDPRERSALIRSLSAADRPSAIVVSGPELAAQVYDASREVGLRIGSQISILGIDDPVGGACFDPPITVISLPIDSVAKQAMTLIDRLARRESFQSHKSVHERLSADLIVRSSVGPSPAD